MTQAPPPVGYNPSAVHMQQPAQSNPLAIVSLICGIVGCLFITPIVGIITGLMALPKAKVAGGKGMAIAGIVLSILWIIGGIGFGAATYWGVNKIYSMVADTAKQPTITFINHLVDGDIAAASKMTDIREDQLKPISDYVKPLGKCQDVTIETPNLQMKNGITTASFTGTATFEKGTKHIEAMVVADGSGVKVQSIELK